MLQTGFSLMRPAPTPTFADLYLAFRQAKTALYFERRGVGLHELAEFEQDLPNKLRELRRAIERQPEQGSTAGRES